MDARETSKEKLLDAEIIYANNFSVIRVEASFLKRWTSCSRCRPSPEAAEEPLKRKGFERPLRFDISPSRRPAAECRSVKDTRKGP
ncbi:hypothetical protein IEQ34_016673 [Dendrobium chrysotoxum]|uniref:Uncharacterized protein n=1 Tax=Dendrobium chrysotoxum TaxID=161865 RepID=A0AAV7GFR7_DENCH|nr:hypothetical protein IEQ34_016673 [Dendrobium chrysotoxum]